MDRTEPNTHQEEPNLNTENLTDLFNDIIDVICDHLNRLSEKIQYVTPQETQEIENFFSTKDKLFAEFTETALDDLEKRKEIILQLQQLALNITAFANKKLGTVWS